MVSTAISRIDGVSTSTAVKSPVHAVATTNIILSGLQTVGGVTLDGSTLYRVLLTGQTDTTQNGIYDASTGSWARSSDFDGEGDAVTGTLICGPTSSIPLYYRVTSANPVIPGTSSIAFDSVYQLIGGMLVSTSLRYDQTAAESAVSVTPVNLYIPSHDVIGIALAERYQTNTTPLTTDMGPGLQKSVKVAIQASCDAGYISDCRIATTVNIDRAVDGATVNFWFNLRGFGKKLYVDTAIPIFSSSIAYTTDPVTQLTNFNNCRFVADAAATNCYILDGARFMRTAFTGCSGEKIRICNATTYLQSIYLLNSEFRNWTGTFITCSGTHTYDMQVIGGMYEGGATGFNLKAPWGCKFWTQIEGLSGTALILPDSKGVDISCYFEANALDIDFRTGNTNTKGVNLHGSVFLPPGATYSVKWGTCSGCISSGNWSSTNLHDLQSDSVVQIADAADGNVSNADAITNRGVRQGSALSINVRGAASAGYTWAISNAKYTTTGNRVDIEFAGTLTSTGVNAADQIFINSGLPYDANFTGGLAGTIYVSGSGTPPNVGVSPLQLTATSPAQLTTANNVLPANVATNAWTVRGQISYITA